MNESVAAITLNVIIKDDQILLIKRTLGDYIGYFGLPGGKIETTEHLADSAEREAYEETRIKTKFKKLLGIVSEHLWDEDSLKEHFLLFVCEMIIEDDAEALDDEDLLDWFPVNQLEKYKEEIIPSDLIMIKHFIIDKSTMFFECDLKKHENKYIVKSTRFLP